MPVLIFLPYVGEGRVGGGEEEEERRVRRPPIGGRGAVTMTATTGATLRGTDCHSPGGDGDDDDDDDDNRLRRMGVTAAMHQRLVDNAGIVIVGIRVFSILGTPPPPL